MVAVPPILLEAIKEQRAVLFLGAGASRDAIHPKGEKIPQGDGLRNIICDKFLGGALKQKPLTAVAAIAANEAGLSAFQLFIRDLFAPFEPADFHMLLPRIRWRAIATTNFDLVVERAYERVPDRVQNLVKTVKDGDSFDIRLHKEVDPVGFYKLHGCIDFYTDLDIPLILGNEQYASYETNRGRFYSRFRDLGFEYPIVFAGYSISDPHIQRVLFDLTDPKIGRPPFYLIAPGISDVETRYWASHRVTAVDTTFQAFLMAVDGAIPAAARALPVTTGGGTLSLRKHYRIAQAVEPGSVAAYIASDVIHIHPGLTAERQDPRDFYRGYDNGWGCILQNLDAHRTVSDSVLVDAVLLAEEDRKPVELFILKGPAGNGKTVSLKRIAWEAGATYDQLVLYANGPAAFRIDPLSEIYQLTGKRVFLFVDRVALARNELRDLLQSARAQSLPLSVVGAERDNEWGIYCEQLEPYLRHEFPIRYLNEEEIHQLLELLDQHKALGLLQDRGPKERVEAFTKNAGRQLLVALHEATLGIPFEDIVVDEFTRIEPAVARSLYLDICALHQFGAPVRAGLVSRASGISFDQFQSEFIQPLENVVHALTDSHTGDIYYRSRHQHVAEIVFNRVLQAAEDKFDLLARLLAAINVDYSSDRETFSRLIKGRGIAGIFPSVDLGRLFYDKVQEAAPNDPFVLHQRAVFEMQHPGGSLVLAEEAAARAFALNPTSQSIRHTQGEVARRLANDTGDPLRKITLRRIVREKVGGQVARLSEYDLHTRAQLAIDEFREFAASLESSGDKAPPPAFIEAAKEAETAIQRGLQQFPESAELLAAEATFRELVDQTDRAQKALERAFQLNPRQDWLAVRLARKYRSSGDDQNARKVLDACLRDNPSSKIVHLDLGRLLIDRGDIAPGIAHLKRSFTEGDNHYEAQFWYARELFLQGQFPEAERLFSALNDRAPGSFRTRPIGAVERDELPVVYRGRIERKEEGYSFLQVPQFPKNIFASRADSSAADWDRLCNGAAVKCKIAFNRRGARAISVQLT